MRLLEIFSTEGETDTMLMRIHRVANTLDVCKKRVYQMVYEGKLQAVRLGPRSMRITSESLDAFLQGRRIAAREEFAYLDLKGAAARDF